MGYICLGCGYEGAGKKIPRGSRAMEIFIWSVLIIPGPFYSVWRRVGLKRICSQCNVTGMVPLKSEAGQMMQYKIEYEIMQDAKKPVASPNPPESLSSKPSISGVSRSALTIDPNCW